MVITTYFQTKQSMASMTDPAQRKMMTWMMPGMMFVFSAVMPSGLVLYWIVSNLWGIGQYAIINKNKDCAAPLSKNMANASVKDAKIVKPKKKKKSN
jgi:YidC/Oxa1 family membrane protein insertase